ncbi:MAG: hypothetical protein OXU22_00535 [Gammaproteobacteria bacterium]|nr:hypothetical protein [Gammaproteobacteria bacterium]
MRLIMPMIEPKLATLQMPIKGSLAHAAEPRQAAFGEAPEALNAVDVAVATGELAAAVMDAIAAFVAQVSEAVAVKRAAVGVGLENRRNFSHIAVFHHLRIGLAGALYHTEHRSFACRARDPRWLWPNSTAPSTNGLARPHRQAMCWRGRSNNRLSTGRLMAVVCATLAASMSKQNRHKIA